jgi:hypothetical protein
MTSAKAATASSYAASEHTAPGRAHDGFRERADRARRRGGFGRKGRIEVPHVGRKCAANSQNLGIARRERQGAIVLLTRLREVEVSYLRNKRPMLRWPVPDPARARAPGAHPPAPYQSASRTAVGVIVPRQAERAIDRPANAERIVRIEANRFRKRGNRRFGRSLAFVCRAKRLAPAQIRIERGRIVRPAELDFGRDIAEERDFEGAGHSSGNLGLKFQHIT